MNRLIEKKWAKPLIMIAALSAMIATLLGAFAAHSLNHFFTEYQMRVFQTGVLYQFIHSLAVLFIGILLFHIKHRFIQMSALLFLVGIVLFSGSLYLLSLLQFNALGMLTPFGGLAFILGWCLLAVGVYQSAD